MLVLLLLMNVVPVMMGKLMPMPVILLVTSALATTCLSILELVIGVFLFTVGAFMPFQPLENITEGSAGVLREIETQITKKAKRCSCFYNGAQKVRRHFSARVFRRRIIRMRMGELRNIESGFAIEFSQQTTVCVYGQCWHENVAAVRSLGIISSTM